MASPSVRNDAVVAPEILLTLCGALATALARMQNVDVQGYLRDSMAAAPGQFPRADQQYCVMSSLSRPPAYLVHLAGLYEGLVWEATGGVSYFHEKFFQALIDDQHDRAGTASVWAMNALLRAQLAYQKATSETHLHSTQVSKAKAVTKKAEKTLAKAQAKKAEKKEKEKARRQVQQAKKAASQKALKKKSAAKAKKEAKFKLDREWKKVWLRPTRA